MTFVFITKDAPGNLNLNVKNVTVLIWNYFIINLFLFWPWHHGNETA